MKKINCYTTAICASVVVLFPTPVLNKDLGLLMLFSIGNKILYLFKNTLCSFGLPINL